jgi:hypothetical protein
VTIVPGTYIVATGAAGLIEKLRETFGALTAENRSVHREHPPSLVAAMWRGVAAWVATGTVGRPAAGRTPSN